MMKNFSRVLARRPSESTVIAHGGFVGLTGIPSRNKWTAAQGPQPFRTDPAAFRSWRVGADRRSTFKTLRGR